jgi:hypothetical protein
MEEDSIIDSILTDLSSVASSRNPSTQSKSINAVNKPAVARTASFIKCLPEQLHHCNALRCTKCDFLIQVFPNQEWKTSIDYMFFRNYMPNRIQLQLGSSSRPGTSKLLNLKLSTLDLPKFSNSLGHQFDLFRIFA